MVRIIKVMRMLLFILISLLLILPAPPVCAAEGKVAIVMSHEAPSYRMAAEGFKALLSQKGADLDYDEYIAGAGGETVGDIAGKIRDSSAILILTLGGDATDGLTKLINDLPVVSGMTLKGKIARKKSNVTGVRIDFPMKTQLEWLRRVVPHARAVGIMYSARENDENIREAARVSRVLGLRLVMEEVNEARDIPYALKSLIKNSDIVLGITDSVVMSPHTAKNILLSTFRASVPVVGLSKSWTKAGALYSLQPDYSDVGRQCGEMALRILEGATTSSMLPEYPEKVTYSLNSRTAEYMKMEFPEKLLKGADEVY